MNEEKSRNLREIEDILLFRNDISPFLVHLTKNTSKRSAKENLENILKERKLEYGLIDEYKAELDKKLRHDDLKSRIPNFMSPANYCTDLYKLTIKDAIKYFHAISFTETPLDQIHNLLEIGRRNVELEPYGLVFIKKELENKGVMPVWYINNINDDKQPIIEQIVQALIERSPNDAYKILPFIAIFGKGFKRPGSKDVKVDFRWEREWRYVSENFEFKFDEKDIFIGLCKREDIDYFEENFGNLYKIERDGKSYPLHFIDPLMNPRYFATKLVNARQRTDLKYSVV